MEYQDDSCQKYKKRRPKFVKVIYSKLELNFLSTKMQKITRYALAVSIQYTYGVNVFDVSEVKVVDAGFELVQYLIVTSHIRRQYQLPQLLQTQYTVLYITAFD